MPAGSMTSARCLDAIPFIPKLCKGLTSDGSCPSLANPSTASDKDLYPQPTSVRLESAGQFVLTDRKLFWQNIHLPQSNDLSVEGVAPDVAIGTLADKLKPLKCTRVAIDMYYYIKITILSLTNNEIMI
jgi:hypothetical protein